MASNSCYGSFAPPVSKSLEIPKNIQPHQSKASQKKASKKATQKANKKAPSHVGPFIIINTIYAIISLFYWLLMAMSFVLWLIVESGMIYSISGLGWLIITGGFLFYGLVLLAAMNAKTFVKKVRKEIKNDMISGFEGIYSKSIASAFLMLIGISLLFAFPISLFLINWAMTIEIIMAFGLLLLGTILFFVGQSKSTKTALISAQPLDNYEHTEEEYTTPIKENNSPLPQAQSEEYYIQD